MKLLKIKKCIFPENAKELVYSEGTIIRYKRNVGYKYVLDLPRVFISDEQVSYSNYAYFDKIHQAKDFLKNKKGIVNTKFGVMEFN